MIKLFLTCLMFMLPAAGIARAAPDSQCAAESLLSSFMSYTDLRIVSVRRSLEILAASNEAKSGDWEGMKDMLGAYQKSDGGLALWFARPDGAYYTADKGLMNVTLADRSYFPSLMANQTITGALVVSRSTGLRSAVIAVPIEANGKVVGAIGASLFLDRLAEQIDAMLELGPDAAFFALAPNGQTTLHRKTDRHFLDPRELGSDTLRVAANEMLSKNSGRVGYEFDNAMKQAIYRTSPLTGWKFAIVTGASAQK